MDNALQPPPDENVEQTASTPESSVQSRESAPTNEVESQLDALDASPQAVRRGRIVLVTIAILFVVAIVTIIAAPPLSWKPPKSDKNNYATLSRATEIQRGAAAPSESYVISYSPIVAETRYAFRLEQTTTYDGDKLPRPSTRTTVEAELRLTHPVRKDFEDDSVSMRFFDVSVHVFDSDSEVPLASAGSMLEGISLYARIEKNHGLGRAVPDANVNPQTARVLLVIVDAFRNIWSPSPAQGVGRGDSWTVTPLSDRDNRIQRRAVSTVQSIDAHDARLETTVTLVSLGAGGEREVGRGKVWTHHRDGRIVEGHMELTREGALWEDDFDIASQTIRFEMHAQEAPPME